MGAPGSRGVLTSQCVPSVAPAAGSSRGSGLKPPAGVLRVSGMRGPGLPRHRRPFAQPSRPPGTACLFGWRDDGDGMGQAGSPSALARRVLDLAVSPRTSGVPQDPAHPRRRTLMSPASPTAHDPAFSGALAGIIPANAPLKPESRTPGTPEAREASARVCAGARPLAAPTRAHSVRAPLPRNRPWWGWDGCEPSERSASVAWVMDGT
jgi:hypothetical protein